MGKKSGLFLLCGAVLLFCLYAVRISYPAGTSGFPEVQAVTEVRTYDSLKKTCYGFFFQNSRKSHHQSPERGRDPDGAGSC